MATLKPWYKVVTPREDLRLGKPLDAAEFAVHLDQVRDQRAPDDYRNPERFFDRTYLTKNLTALAGEVIRRLSGLTTETSAIFNMTTQFGGGKTHALTLLYHLAESGPSAHGWTGVGSLLAQAGVGSVPRAATAVFVGTEFDSIAGRGGDDGTPVRKTPWGEIAWQLRREEGLAIVAEHDRQGIAPAGDVIQKLLPRDSPCLILMDELMNYISRNRRSGLAAQLYDFLHNLSETVRGRTNAVLAVSIPASDLEMTADDQADYDRLKKLLDRLGKPVIMSAEAETSEIIRRRLFEWDPRAMASDGTVLLPRDAVDTCRAYATWLADHRQQIPSWFPTDNAREQFESTYPFHPMVFSVFERKWQELPRFQQTRGVLRILALWVARTFQEGFKGAHRDPVISLGTAPLDDSLFRTAVFEQLGESRLEGAVTTDICGKKDSHAVRLDKEAVETIARARLHRRVATTIFFESNGGQLRAEATVPEIRLGVAEADLDIGNVETVLETLASSCYYLSVERNRYRFSLSPNLNKLLSDRRASIRPERIQEKVRAEVQKVFAKGSGVERVFFPERSGQIPDRAALTFVILPPDQSLQDERETLEFIEKATREHGSSSRTFKNALIWCVADSTKALQDDARRVLAWEDISDEVDTLRLDDSQKKQLPESIRTAQRDIIETVWRTYKNVVLLGKDNQMRLLDLGLIHSSAANTILDLIVSRLSQDGDLEEKAISPNYLIRNWPPAFREWSTRAVRDAFYASPQFPRLLNGESIKDTIVRGVNNGLIAYVGRTPDGNYEPAYFGGGLTVQDVELTDSMFIVMQDAFEQAKQVAAGAEKTGTETTISEGDRQADGEHLDRNETRYGKTDQTQLDIDNSGQSSRTAAAGIRWQGNMPAQKWMNFYMKVLSKFGAGAGLQLRVSVEVNPDGGISSSTLNEIKLALRELGLTEDVDSM